LFGFILIILSLIAFSANVIQYGIDQLEYDDCDGNFVQYVYWYVWTCYMDQLFIINIVNSYHFWNILVTSLISLIVLPIVLGITFCIKRNLDLVDTPPQTENPYKLIYQIINYYYYNSLHRNEAPPSSRLDLAKEKY
jgi:hypothetical protein